MKRAEIIKRVAVFALCPCCEEEHEVQEGHESTVKTCVRCGIQFDYNTFDTEHVLIAEW